MDSETIAMWGSISALLLGIVIFVALLNTHGTQYQPAANAYNYNAINITAAAQYIAHTMERSKASSIFGANGQYNTSLYNSTGNSSSGLISTEHLFGINITSVAMERYAGPKGDMVEEVFDTMQPVLLYNELRYYIESSGKASKNSTSEGVTYFTGTLKGQSIDTITSMDGNVVVFAAVIWLNATRDLNGTVVAIIANDTR